MKKLTLIAALAAMTATPAMAQVSSPTVDLSGNVAVSCTVTGIDAMMGFGPLGPKGQTPKISDTGVDIFCNQPSTATFTSLNGGLKLDSTSVVPADETSWDAVGNPGFNAGLDYTIDVPKLNASLSTVALTAGTPLPITPLPAFNENNVKINYDTINSTDPLIGGDYKDTLTITLSPNGV